MDNNKSLTQTFNLLKYTFGIVPIVAGADKFTNILTNWEQYINPSIALTLLLGFNYVDVAIRDLVMAIAALSMARLAKIV